MVRLGVNVDHTATLRQARGGQEPDPVTAAMLAELAGAHGITIHLREDRRHIQERDLRLMRQTVTSTLNLEMAATEEMVGFALEQRPEVVTLVPERRQELTTEGGLDALALRDQLQRPIELMREGGIRVSLFVDAQMEQIKAARRLGVDAVELHTGPYSEAANRQDMEAELEQLAQCTRAAKKLGLEVAAGHGLNYRNAGAVASIPGIEELNIGHSIISRAVLVGMERAVADMLALVQQASS